MFRGKKLFSVLIAVLFSSVTLAANEATSFQIPLGYGISQGFNTSSDYVINDSDSAWCADSSFIPKSKISKESCEASGYRWIYGHTGYDLSNGSCGGSIKAIANGEVEFSGNFSGYGNLLKLKHVLPSGKIIHSLYGHRRDVTLSVGKGRL